MHRINPDHVMWSAPEAERADRPLLVMLHGHGSNERVGFELRHHLPPELVLASVRGPRQVGGGYAWFALDATISLGDIEDSATAVLDWLHGLDQRGPVGILGFSQGVATAFQMIRREPDRFGYAVNLSGAVVPFPAAGDAQFAEQRLPVFWGRGSADPVLPAMLVDPTRAWLSRNTDLNERVYPGLGHNVSAAELNDLSAFIREHLPAAG
jgi:phospholipase/carboxylesterase